MWWCQVSDAVRVKNNISDNLIAEKSTALFFPKHVPWYDFLFDYIRNILHRKNSSNRLDVIDASDWIFKTSDDVGKFISEKYRIKTERWPGYSYAEFLSSRDDISLNNTYVWVRGINKTNYKQWCSFAEEYEICCIDKKNRATFILEYFEDGDKNIPVYRNIDVIYWENEIKSYDYYLFCSMLVSDLKCSDELKYYIAELVFLLGECHAEFCARLSEYKERFAENPEMVLKECAEIFRYDDDEKIQLANLNVVEQVVIEAQIKNVFPVIERYRRKFITDNYDQLRIILQNEDSEPYDLDIGNIKYLIQSGTLNMELQKQKELEFFHKSRNKIAHSNIISYNDVKKILNRYSKSN